MEKNKKDRRWRSKSADAKKIALQVAALRNTGLPYSQIVTAINAQRKRENDVENARREKEGLLPVKLREINEQSARKYVQKEWETYREETRFELGIAYGMHKEKLNDMYSMAREVVTRVERDARGNPVYENGNIVYAVEDSTRISSIGLMSKLVNQMCNLDGLYGAGFVDGDREQVIPVPDTTNTGNGFLSQLPEDIRTQVIIILGQQAGSVAPEWTPRIVASNEPVVATEGSDTGTSDSLSNDAGEQSLEIH
jgi:DNA-binding transcriptional MerR regulator